MTKSESANSLRAREELIQEEGMKNDTECGLVRGGKIKDVAVVDI